MKRKRGRGAEEPLENDYLAYEEEDPETYYEESYNDGYEYEDDYEDEYYDDEEEYYDEEEYAAEGSLRRTALYMLAVLVASVLLAVAGWFMADDVLALTKPDNDITVTIEQDDDLGDVAQILKDHGLIRYKLLFLLYGKFSHAEEDIHPGSFELNQQFDYHALVNGLSATSDTRMTVTLTFPEGYSCSQIFSMLAANDVCSLEALEETAANYEFDYDFLSDLPYGEPNRLEGYLFPDTYEFYTDDDPERVINRLLGNFEDKFSDEMIEAISMRNEDIRSRMEDEGTFSEEEIEDAMMDMYKIVTLASLIEKEAGSESERSLISSVIYNRLTTHVHELLQVDATVEYVLGEDHEGPLTEADLSVESPYNTYLYKGLPPGPIANPGLASIMAAIYPKDTDFFFYALSEEGDHEFFETYMEQQDYLMGIEPQTPAAQPEPEPEPEYEEQQDEEEEGFEQVPYDGEEPEDDE